MENEDATLSPAESQQPLVQPPGTTRSSNRRALKIAGITTLACLLLSAQAFTAYMVFDQKHQIQDLQLNNYKLERQMVSQRRVAPQKMVMPIASLPLMDVLDDEMTSENGPKSKPPKLPTQKPVTSPSVEDQLKELIKDLELPQMEDTLLASLETLQQQLTESDFKSFESWLRYWMIFQKAQKTPTPTPESDEFEDVGGLE